MGAKSPYSSSYQTTHCTEATEILTLQLLGEEVVKNLRSILYSPYFLLLLLVAAISTVVMVLVRRSEWLGVEVMAAAAARWKQGSGFRAAAALLLTSAPASPTFLLTSAVISLLLASAATISSPTAPCTTAGPGLELRDQASPPSTSALPIRLSGRLQNGQTHNITSETCEIGCLAIL